MANAGPDSNGSLFFITHCSAPTLNGRHTVFGHVVEGQDVIDAIEQGDTIITLTIVRNGPSVCNYEPPHPTPATVMTLDDFRL